jgi:hypothetical protein
MRYYATKRIDDLLHLVCIKCPYQVVVTSFDQKDGNTRMQAAKAINDHAASSHPLYRFWNSDTKHRELRKFRVLNPKEYGLES